MDSMGVKSARSVGVREHTDVWAVHGAHALVEQLKVTSLGSSP